MAPVGGAHPNLPHEMASWIRFVPFLDSRPAGETVLLLMRGIDGGSIFPVAYETLLVRWPRLCFQLVFMVSEEWFALRGLASPLWVRAATFGGKVYGVFEDTRLLENCLGIAA
jgi:hypothetical protein